MKLVEVKNDIAKIVYNPAEHHFLPADFILIEDANQKIISQIINIEATNDSVNNNAYLKLVLDIDKEENLSYYSGYIPSKNAKVIYINPDEILELIKGNEENIYFGNLSNHQESVVKVPVDFVDDKLYIQSDRRDSTSIIIRNLISQLKQLNKKIILLDFYGTYSFLEDVKRVKVSEDFRLPLNIDAFNTIYENDINDCPIEDKALVQSIILELREYLKTLKDKFIPFTLFKNVVEDQFLQNQSSGLMLLRNKLWLYAQDAIFAENNNQYLCLNNYFKENNVMIIDVSALEDKWYKFIIQTVLSVIEDKCYIVMDLDDITIDKKAVNAIYNTSNIIPIVSTSFGYNYAQLIKSVCNNRIICKNLVQNDENEPYHVLADKLKTNEFMMYGESTLYIPIVVELQIFDSSTADTVIQNEIKKDVDDMLTISKKMVPAEGKINESILSNTSFKETISEPVIDESLTDSDLDFLDDLSVNIDNSTTDINNENSIRSYDVFAPDGEKKLQSKDDILNEIGIDKQEYYQNNPSAKNDSSNKEFESYYSSGVDEYRNTSDVLDKYMGDDGSSLAIATPDDLDLPENNTPIIMPEEDETPEGQYLSDVSSLSEEHTIHSTNIEYIESPQSEQRREYSVDLDSELVNIDYNETKDKQNNINDTQSDFQIIEDESENNNSSQMQIINDEEQKVDENSGIEFIEELPTKNESELIIKEEEPEEIVQAPAIEPHKEPEHTQDKEKEEDNIQKQKESITVYETDKAMGTTEKELPFKVGDRVFHPKHGKGIVEGFTNYSNKILFCQIEFENVGRRILDPTVAGIEKID